MSEGPTDNQVALRPYDFPPVCIMLPSFVFMLEGHIKTPLSIGQSLCPERKNAYCIGRERGGRAKKRVRVELKRLTMRIRVLSHR
jgi:hypothetical protein